MDPSCLDGRPPVLDELKFIPNSCLIFSLPQFHHGGVGLPVWGWHQAGLGLGRMEKGLPGTERLSGRVYVFQSLTLEKAVVQAEKAQPLGGRRAGKDVCE